MTRALLILSFVSIFPAEAICQSSSTVHVFPQFADGAFVDGSRYRSTLMATNSDTAAAATNCVFRLRGLTTGLRDVQGNTTMSGDTFSLNLSANGWTILQSLGTQNIATGYATLQCDRAVTAQLLYAFYDRNGTKLSETAVFGAPRVATVQFLADQREGARIGVAVANDSDSAAEYDIFAGDAQGRLIGAATINMGARSSMANFLDEWIAVPSTYSGQVVITSRLSSAPPAVVALRFTGTSFATISVSAGTFPPGAASPAPNVIPSTAGLRLTPSVGAVGSTVNVTIEGAGFVQGATTLSISGTAVTSGSVNVVSATSLIAVITINTAALSGERTVTARTGLISLTGVFTVVPAPLITSLNPAIGNPGQTITNFTITGSNFNFPSTPDVVFIPTGATLPGTGFSVTNVQLVNSTTITFSLSLSATLLVSDYRVEVRAAGVRTQANDLPGVNVYAVTRFSIVEQVTGRIFDVDSTRILFLDDSGFLKIRNRSSETVTAIAPVLGRFPRYGFLSPRGAIFVAQGESFQTAGVYEWRDGAMVSLGGFISYADLSGSLKVKGNFAIWTSGPDTPNCPASRLQDACLILRDLQAGTNTKVFAVTPVVHDLSADGSVAYWNYSGGGCALVYHYSRGMTTGFTTDLPCIQSPAPLTDGINVVYRRTGTLILATAGDLALTNGASEPGADYQVNGGWVAFRKDSMIWTRSPQGQQAAAGAGRLLALGPNGEIMTDVGGRLKLSAAALQPIELGPVPDKLFWMDGGWFATVGRTLYGVLR